MHIARMTAAAAGFAAFTVLGLGTAQAQSSPVCTGAEDFTGARDFAAVKWSVVSQCWSEETRKAFWFTSQGSRMLPYDWFLNLEQADGQELFRAPGNIRSFGYLPAPADARWNPDGLPIGFARGAKDANGTVWAGPTCALCHTNLMVYGEKTLFIDGAPSLGDFEAFNVALVDAMVATDGDEAKFARFARAVLKADGGDAAKVKALRNAFQVQMQVLARRNEQNNPAHRYGNGRVDAVGAILNQVLATDLWADSNRGPSDAPVSFPFLWGTPQSSVVQWTGFAPNNKYGVGPLVRNVGEVLGVYGVVDVANISGQDFTGSDYDWSKVEKGAWPSGYKSSVDLSNLGKLEGWVQALRAPRWPENLLPAIDQARAARGARVYAGLNDNAYGAESFRVEAVRCATCHAVVARENEGESYDPQMVQVAAVGTDPVMADNFLLQRNPRTFAPWQTGRLEGTKALMLAGDRYGPELAGNRAPALVSLGIGVILGHPLTAGKAAYESFFKEMKTQTFDARSYKARPLNGIWATAPFLHNGSVPTLHDLLLPGSQRPATFQVGDRTFDPARVGFVTTTTTAGSGGFLFDTRLRGNGNAGHEGAMYGTELTEDQRRDLLEYLKTL